MKFDEKEKIEIEFWKNAAEENPSVKGRSLTGTLYYAVLSKLPFLQGFLPCTVDILMTKK